MQKYKKIIITSLFLSAILSVCVFYSLPYKSYNIPVEKVYVINLERSKARLEKIGSSLNNQGIKFERFPAVMGIDLKIKDENGTVFFGKDLKSGKVKFKVGEVYKVYCPNITLNYKYNPLLSIDGDPLTAGEFGVYCSHMEIMLDVVKNKYKSVVVFEDDALIPEDFGEKLKKIETSMPNYRKGDIIYLGHAISTNKWLEKQLKLKNILFNDTLQKVTDYKVNFGAVHAMLYGYNGAKKMIDLLEPNAGIDLDLFKEANNGRIGAYNAKHLNVIQDPESPSEIKDMGRSLS